MSGSNISRRLFIRVLGGLFAFVPAARSLTALAADRTSVEVAGQLLASPHAPSQLVTQESLETRIAEGKVLSLEGSSIWIRDWKVDRLRLIVTEESTWWKGKYNQGNNLASYPHPIEAGDDVIARGRRNGSDFVVERMFVNIVNIYIVVDSIRHDVGEDIISFSSSSQNKGVVRLRPDYLGQALYAQVENMRQQLRGKTVQVIGLHLKDDTIIATNVVI